MSEETIEKQIQLEWLNLLDKLQPSKGIEFMEHYTPEPPAIYALMEDVRAQIEELHSKGMIRKYAERFVTTGWTVKQLLSHIASWALELRREAETIAQNQSFDYTIPWALSVIGPTQWNQTEVEKRSAQNIEEAIRELFSEIERVQDLVLILPSEILHGTAEFPHSPAGDPTSRLKGSLARMCASMTSHFRYHIQRLRESFERFEKQ